MYALKSSAGGVGAAAANAAGPGAAGLRIRAQDMFSPQIYLRVSRRLITSAARSDATMQGGRQQVNLRLQYIDNVLQKNERCWFDRDAREGVDGEKCAS